MDYLAGVVHLFSPNTGTLLEIPESKLSAEDLGYIRTLDVYKKAQRKVSQISPLSYFFANVIGGRNPKVVVHRPAWGSMTPLYLRHQKNDLLGVPRLLQFNWNLGKWTWPLSCMRVRPGTRTISKRKHKGLQIGSTRWAISKDCDFKSSHYELDAQRRCS